MLRREPTTNLVVGLAAIAMGIGFGVLAVVSGDRWTTVVAANGLTLLGVVYIAVMTHKR